jgi:hypothetical protein
VHAVGHELLVANRGMPAGGRMARAAALPAVGDRKSGPGSRGCAGRGEEGRGSAAADGGEGGPLGPLDRRRREMKDVVVEGRRGAHSDAGEAGQRGLVVLANAGAGRGAGAGGRRPGRSRPGRAGCRHRSPPVVGEVGAAGSPCDELEESCSPRARRSPPTTSSRGRLAPPPARVRRELGLTPLGRRLDGRRWHQRRRDLEGAPGLPGRGREPEARRTREEDGGARGRELRRRLVLAGQGNR